MSATSNSPVQLPLTIDVQPAAPGSSSREYLIVTIVASIISVAAFVYYYRAGELLLYGDAVAHMNISRRVVDTRLPGFFQLGTVWLPLPHVLMLPLIWSTKLWQNGIAGSIPSMLAYVVGVLGIFRLVLNGLYFLPANRNEARIAGWFAALAYALNPNLLYLQSTAMTEPLYLAIFIWATVFLTDFGLNLWRGDDTLARRSLVYCGSVLLLGMLTRYDGWFTAAAYGFSVLVLLITANRRSGLEPLHFLYERSWRRAVLTYILLLAVVPVGWFIYNNSEFKDPLAFARGPYSAKGIEARSRRAGDPHHPGWNSPAVAATYFIKSAKLNVAVTERSERIWVYAALLASVMLLGYLRPLWPWLLLWIPVPFYAISMAWGGVPIFIPVWYPFSYYNVRYGTQLLPTFTVFGALLLYLLVRRFTWQSTKNLVTIAAVLFIISSYYYIWRDVPISLREARVNSVDRLAIEGELAAHLSQLPSDSTVLIYIGQHGGALQQIGFPLHRTYNECLKRIWESALLEPARTADFIVATDGDPIALAVVRNSDGLVPIARIESPRQASITVYRSDLSSHK